MELKAYDVYLESPPSVVVLYLESPPSSGCSASLDSLVVSWAGVTTCSVLHGG